MDERNARDRALDAAEQRNAAEALKRKAAQYATLTRAAASDEDLKERFLYVLHRVSTVRRNGMG